MSTTRVSHRLRAASVAVALLAAGTGLSSAAAHADVPPPTIVYTANQTDDAVYGVNAATGAVTQKIPVGYADGIGPGLDEITPAPGGRVLYALSSGYGYVRYNGSLVSINAADLQITGHVSLPDGATSFVLSPNGATAYVVVGTRIEVVDLSTMTVTASVSVGAAGPGSLLPAEAISPDGSTLYVSDFDGSDLTVIDTATNAVTATVPAQADEADVALSPDGSTAYVLGQNTTVSPPTPVVTAIATATDIVTATIPVNGNALRLAVSPDGHAVYTWGPGAQIGVISTKSDTVTEIIALPEVISWLALSPDGSKAVATFDDGTISADVIDLATHKITKSVSLPSARAQEAVFSPDGARVYVLSEGIVYVVAPATGAVDGTVTEGIGPMQNVEPGQQMLAVGNQGKDIYVGNLGDTVSAVDVASKTLAGEARSAMHTPGAIAITADGQHAYVAGLDGSDLRLFDLATGKPVGAPIKVGAEPDGIALTPDGTQALVSNSMSNTVSVIDTASGAVTATIPVNADPQQIVMDGPDTAYVTGGASTEELNLTTDTVAATVHTYYAGGGLALSPDGSTLYVPVLKGVDVINTATNTLTSTITLPGNQNYGDAISPDGSRLYVTGGPINIGVVYVVDLTTDKVVAHAPAKSLAEAIAISPDGSQVYLASLLAPRLSVLSTSTDTITGTYKVGTGNARTVVSGIAVDMG